MRIPTRRPFVIACLLARRSYLLAAWLPLAMITKIAKAIKAHQATLSVPFCHIRISHISEPYPAPDRSEALELARTDLLGLLGSEDARDEAARGDEPVQLVSRCRATTHDRRCQAGNGPAESSCEMCLFS